jgi:Flp pilus assembly protein TadD
MAAFRRGRHGGLVKVGPYEVLSELGRGGMGAVYRVRAVDGHEHALKVLFKMDAAAVTRFERERRLLASLGEKTGFVGLLEAGTTPEGLLWLLMPLVPGGTLRQKLLAGPLGVEETIALGARLATALGHAHERGIVHRDMKPENVLFTASGEALIADLGLAKHFDRSTPGARQSVALTADGTFKGTAGYAAPEQLSDAARAGPPADVFALGAMLYECLAGKPAFRGNTVFEVLTSIGSGKVEPLRGEAPPWLERVLIRALAPGPGARFRDGAELAGALRGGGKRRAPLLVAIAGVVVAGAAVSLVAFRPLAGGFHGPPTAPGPTAPGSTAKELDETARRKIEKGDLEGAIADCSRAIELEPGLARAWSDRGRARSRTRQMDQQDRAVADCSRAIELDPTLAEAWCYRGLARFFKGQNEAAIAEFTRAIELDPRLAAAFDGRGVALTHDDKLDEAERDLARALELDPRNGHTWSHRAIVMLKRGDMDRAIADCSRAVELDPSMYRAWCNLGFAREKKGDVEGAVQAFERALALVVPGGEEAEKFRGYIERARAGAR